MRMGKRRRRPPVPRNSRGGSPSSRRPTVSQARPMVADRGAGPAGNAAAGRARRPALAPSRGAWCAGGRPRPTARGAGHGVADAAGRARPPEHRPDRAADWAWRPPQAAVLVAQRPTHPTAREVATVTTARLAMPEPIVEKAPLLLKSEYCLVKLCSSRITLLLICFSDRNHKLIEQLLNCHKKMNLLHSVD